jgi:ribulose-5-phosphate 4-epimerase/fuculose-1-phosphate aldolase
MKNINQIKKDLAFAHKIISHLSMDDLTYTHISNRSDSENMLDDIYMNNNEVPYFFLSPFGLCFENVESHNILEINYNNKIIGANKDKTYNPTGVTIHSSIYKFLPNINSIIHLHTKSSIAVSALKFGLLPISQHAFHFFNRISYHSYDSLVLSEEMQASLLIKDLGENNVMFLRNHGFITVGKTIQEALFYAYHLERACKIQCALSSFKYEDFIFPKDEICEKAYSDLINFEKDLGSRDWNAWKIKLDYDNSK